MLLVDDIALFPFKSILMVFREIYNAAVQELEHEGERIRLELSQLYISLESGAIDEATFDERERVLLDRLDALEAQQSGAEEVEGTEVTGPSADDEVDDDDGDDEEDEVAVEEDDESDAGPYVYLPPRIPDIDERQPPKDVRPMRTKKASGSRNGHFVGRPPDGPTRTSRSNRVSPVNLTEAPDVVEEIEIDEVTTPISEAPPAMAPIVIPPRTSPAEQASEPHQRRRVLDHLIGMADMYAHVGSLRQAIELYFEVLSDHDGTPQAAEAENRLLAIAQHYEDQRELRLARGIYERLLKTS